MTAVWVIDERMLRWWGKERGWMTHGEIALGLGLSPSTLSRVLRGKSVPGEALLGAVRLTFGDEAFTDICQVVDPETPAPPARPARDARAVGGQP
jgi:transcriptional regulator with XRE-family HTH domain